MDPILVAYKSDPVRGAVWHDVFRTEAPDMKLVDWDPAGEAASAPYLVAWTPPENLAAAMPKVEAFFCIGAGIDHLPIAAFPPGMDVVRMVDPDLTASMVEYVVMAVLALHRDLPFYVEDARAGRWQARPLRRAADRRVGILGLGVMGQAVAAGLQAFGFPVRGWSASRKSLAGVECFAGGEEREAFLAGTDSLVCLLPLTEATRGILNADLFAQLPKGAALVNVGRGGHLVEADLLAALETGQMSGAVLDVLAAEPPAADDPLLRHPEVWITPHIASATHPAGAARQVIRGIRALRSGQKAENTVDRSRAY
ncbi:glyoxylate/hydroxypyruvate reductase A [Aureimonas sp. AU20]|uniref:2-hydroxyacid dehydrogenase n=1 Tax=Aureimonas sp. AU20 TaxID=1349819 RepID=UPI0007229693|nr:glyoxylate/hydroxypyruvate reductase A [Aureimonas sp. AU20]ALN72648.1 hypothetical protein M673_07985 [Aureimonas sp. AU20]